MSSKMKLYGVPLSQPFRSVAWTLLQRQVPFDIQLTVPGMTSKVGTLNEAFLSKTRGRTGVVPVLEVNETCIISESPAILSFLCETHEWQDLYGSPGTEKKALIDSYMHWHHSGTRQLAALARPYLRPDLKLQVTDQDKDKAAAVLTSLDEGWLQNDQFIATDEEPTIADMLAYEEIAQVYMTGTLESLDDYQNVAAWMERMSQLPYHEEVHTALKVLGNLVEPSDTPLAKRLGAATKAGVAALKEAQE